MNHKNSECYDIYLASRPFKLLGHVLIKNSMRNIRGLFNQFYIHSEYYEEGQTLPEPRILIDMVNKKVIIVDEDVEFF